MPRTKSDPAPRRSRPVVLFDEWQESGEPLRDKQLQAKRKEALGALGPNHPAWKAIRGILCDELGARHAESLAPAVAGTSQQTHYCGGQAALVDVIAELDELVHGGGGE